jgi:hypothetical protein
MHRERGNCIAKGKLYMTSRKNNASGAIKAGPKITIAKY